MSGPHRPGPRNLITDISGLTVGHATDEALRTGATVIRCAEPMVAAVDVRGGGPGTRETDALDPTTLVEAVHAIVLSGGSAFGLAAAEGAVEALSEEGVGLSVPGTTRALPIVPAAILYDLGVAAITPETPLPYRRLGAEATRAASDTPALGSVGAGRGAVAGTIKGGIGSASLDLGDGLIVGAIAAVNPVGSVLMPGTTAFWAWPFEIDGEFGGIRPDVSSVPSVGPVPNDSKLPALAASPAFNTAIAAVATTANLSPAETKRLAMMAQDGFARAIHPAHTPFDGDTVFALASGAADLPEAKTPRAASLAHVGSAAADTLSRAVARAVFEATASPSEPPNYRALANL